MKFLIFFFAISFVVGGCNNTPAVRDVDSTAQHQDNASNSAFNYCDFLNESNHLWFVSSGTTIQDSDNIYAYNMKDDFMRWYKAFDDNFWFSESNRETKDSIKSHQQRVTLANILMMITDIKKFKLPSGDKWYDEKKDFAAVRIHYGMDRNNMILIFEPIVLKNPKHKSCNISDTLKKYYTFDGNGGFKSVNSSDMEQFRFYYTQHIRLNHYNAETGQLIPNIIKFQDNGEPGEYHNNDIKAAIFPFQQIMLMYHDNHGTCNLSDTLNFTLVASNYYMETENFKIHTVVSYMLGKNTLKHSGEESSYEGLAADFSEMSPPNHFNCQIPIIKNDSKDK